MKKWYILVYGNGNRTIMEESEYWKEQKENYNDPNHYDEALKGIIEAEKKPDWNDLEYDSETGEYILKDVADIKAQLDSLYAGAYEIRELTAPDGTVWEVKIFGDSPECEVRVKGSEEWKDAIWSIFCKNIGVDTDCLA